MASTFSYAQAAKGVPTPTIASKPASGSATPAKDSTPAPAPGSIASARSWAEDVETDPLSDQPATAREARPQSSSSNTARVSRSVDTSSVSSPDLGASSSSTVTKDDDVSSIPNTSSESTWDNKSQASTSVDKSVESLEKTSEKVKKGKNIVVKPLQEAPLPAVNIWKQRADELKAKVPKPATLPTTNGSTRALTKKGDSAHQEKPGQAGDNKSRARDENSQGRKDARGDPDTRKGVKGRAPEKDTKAAQNTLPPPPNRDQESWPTPETVIDEDRKKAQEKGDKERKDGPSTGKHEWVKVPYTPSVVFNTPLPNAANTRRGGRPGGRGGVQAGGRPTGTSNGTTQTEKDGSESESLANGELPRRERADGAGPQDALPKTKNSGAPEVNGEAAKASGATTSDAETQARRASESHVQGQSNTYGRQYSGRPGKGRRGDFSGPGERRRDDTFPPSKDGAFEDRRIPAGIQTDGLGDSERRAGAYQEGPNGHHSKQGRFNSFSGGRGERGRGGGRGARANYTNGHHFTNGHQSMQSSSSFQMGPRSPTNFHPGDNSFFSASQGKYGRNAHRSQSVTTADPYRYAPYQNGPSAAPMQAYPMYDYGMMQPMSAVPFNSYGVDQFALFSVITTQVEYYFSVDNLLKDMYLRRHMDSQGFVSLDFIAGFNRIKSLSTDLELIKLVCQQSHIIEYRTSEQGQDRLRRRENWTQWVLNMAERDESARNDGPKVLHHPPTPQPAGFDQTLSYENNGGYVQTNGHQGVAQDAVLASTENPDNVSTQETDTATLPNGHSAEDLVQA